MRLTAQQVSGLLVLLSGCATQQPAISSGPGALGRIKGLSTQFHVAALAGDATPATYSFQQAKGRLGSAREGFSDAAEIAVTGPALCVIVPGEILGEVIRSAPDECTLVFGTAFAGAAGAVAVAGVAVAVPAVAADGLIRSWKRVSPQELAEREAVLQKALKAMAAQDRFQHFLLANAEEKCPGRLVAMDLRGKAEPAPATMDAVFEARIEELLLERVGSDEGSYFLRIKARARLVRRDGGGLLYEQLVEYRSGRALFLDWTYPGGVQGVAETGYRALAEYYVSQIR